LARDKTATPRRSLRILPRARGTIAVIFVALLIEAACHAFLPFSAGFIVDHLTGGRERDLLLRMLMALGGAFFVSLFVGLLRDSLYAKLQSRSLAHIRLGMFERLQHFSIAFHAVTNQEDVLESFAGDLGIIESAFSMTLTWGALPAMESLFYTGVILWIDWRVGLLSLLVWPWVILAPHAMSKEVNKISESCRDEEVRILAVVEESLTARLVIRAFSLEHMGLALFRKRNELTFDNQITAGKLVSIPILTWLLSEALLLVSEYRPALAEAKIAWARILGLLRDPAPVPDARDPRLLAPLHHEIVFHDVSYSYGEDAALTDVTAKIAKGTHTALVGPAGAGKSTMLRLLMRLQDPQKGSVLIDEVPIKSVSQSSLRSRLGVVLPENFIFNASVRENIRLSQPDASEEKLRDLAKALGIVESPTQLPRGLDTVVGENGFILSGEMRQRVALARALLRNPDVLLLDEIGAQLDPAEEIAIHKTLQATTGGRTVISATHRLSTASDSNLILVMNDTKIVEQGTHAELLALDGFYASLWRKQSGFTFSEDGRLVEADPARLKLLPIFEKIPDEMLVEMAPYFVAETFPAGREIVARGDPGDRFYVIVRGVAEVWRAARETEAVGAEEELVSTLDDGDCFGEMALLTDLPREETVRTTTVCTCISLGRGQFDRVVDKSPELRQLITETTARLLRESIGAATA
jgi:ATP-binding cassette subfamily B protein